MRLSVEDLIWNRAALESGGPAPRAGDAALAAALAVHGLVMNGGVHHAIQVLAGSELQGAIKAFRFLSLGTVASLFEVAEGVDEDLANQRYWDAIPNDDELQNRFRAAYRYSPEAFAPIAR